MDKLYLDDVIGYLGQWLEWDTSDVPQEVVAKLEEAYELAVKGE